MGKSWYLKQNFDVRQSGVNPVKHFLEYGYREGRKWSEPNWFRRAFKKSGWIWKTQIMVLDEILINVQAQQKNYKKIRIERLGNYSNQVKELKRNRHKYGQDYSLKGNII
jgi:hypothetical protein